MKFVGKYASLLFFLLLWAALSCFLQRYRYHFFFTEQIHLFLFDSAYISETFFTVGGAGKIVADFIVQFFFYPRLGAVLTALLLAIAGSLALSLLQRQRSSVSLLIALLCAGSLMLMHLNFNYFIQGTVGYIFVFAALLAVKAAAKKPVYSAALGMALAVALFYLFGSVAILFAVCILLTDKWKFLIPALIIVCVLAYYHSAGNLRTFFLPDMFFHHSLPVPWLICASWILPVIGLIIRFKIKQSALTVSVQVILAVAALTFGVKKYDDSGSLKMKELDYLCRTGQNDKIIKLAGGKIDNFLYLVYLNMALANEGALAERMFAFEQRGAQSLFLPLNYSQYNSALMAEVYYTVGHASAARCMAFEGNIGAQNSRSARMLQKLVQTNLICGDYAAAEKYILMLEKTLCYAQWARGQRMYLYDDKAVEDEPDYALRRKSLTDNDFLFYPPLNAFDLLSCALANPSNRAAIEYLGAMFLLSKDLGYFAELLNRYGGSPVLPNLPPSFQEALVVLNEASTPEELEQKGVSRDVINKFAAFKDYYLKNRGAPNLSVLMNRNFGKTYWYYYTFVKTN